MRQSQDRFTVCCWLLAVCYWLLALLPSHTGVKNLEGAAPRGDRLCGLPWRREGRPKPNEAAHVSVGGMPSSNEIWGGRTVTWMPATRRLGSFIQRGARSGKKVRARREIETKEKGNETQNESACDAGELDIMI